MQTEKSLHKDKRMVPETRFTEFPALSVDPRVGISLIFSETDERFYSNAGKPDKDIAETTHL